MILETHGEIQSESLPDFTLENRLHYGSNALKIEPGLSLDEMVIAYERNLILQLMDQNEYNISKTADMLKVSRHSLRYRMQRVNVPASLDDEEPSSPEGGRSS
jgi:transcriptional regulator with PAS, ATPase and Fis domain